MNEKNNVKVIVDAGHGGVDSGAINGNIYEKDFTLKAANYIYDRLRQLGIPAEMTRTDDTTLDKNARIRKVDELSERDPNVILVSNHINAGGGDGQSVTNIKYNN